MRQNPQSHLDDIAKRFAASAPRSNKATPDTSDDFVDESIGSPPGSNRATQIGIAIFLAVLVGAAVIGLLMLRS